MDFSRQQLVSVMDPVRPKNCLRIKNLKYAALAFIVFVVFDCLLILKKSGVLVKTISIGGGILSLGKTNETESTDKCTYPTQNGMPRILCIVPTTDERYKSQANVAHQIWGKKCSQVIYFTAKSANQSNKRQANSSSNATSDLVQLENLNSEDYNMLTLKMIHIFKYVYENLASTSQGKPPYVKEFDWLIKADDDTFVIYENLELFLREKCLSQNSTFGYTRKGILFNGKILAKSGFNVGGAGYVMSYDAFKRFGRRLVADSTYCVPLTGNEDLDIADCLERIGIVPTNSRDEQGRERFHSEDYDSHWSLRYPSMQNESLYGALKTGMGCCSPSSISFHHLSNDAMLKFYNLIYNIKPYSAQVKQEPT